MMMSASRRRVVWTELYEEVLQRVLTTPSSNTAHVIESVLHECELVPDGAGCLLPAECPSVGSLVHCTGLCKPCVFAHKLSRVCLNGASCAFCHCLHPARRRNRRHKSKLCTQTSPRSDVTSATEASPETLIVESLLHLLLLDDPPY